MACFMVAGDQPHAAGAISAWGGAIVCIQMRLVCNLLDGMVAVEGGKGSPAGVIYNDAPDRVADVLILVGAGYSGAGEPGVVKIFAMLPLGWCAACVALGTAYVRTLGASLMGVHDFRGPMAKQHRMQKGFLTFAFGGPANYSGKGMAAAHRKLVNDMGLNDSHFDAVMEDLGATLVELGVPGDLIAEAAGIAESVRDAVLGRAS